MPSPASKAQRVAFSLGSNIGNRLATLEAACDRLADALGNLRLSQVYETEPVDCPEGSPPYLNACVEAYTALEPEKVLELCQNIEKALGRTRTGAYHEPRTCDIDLLYYGNITMDTPTLTLPHPRAHQREFVLRPLCDIDPLLQLPGQTMTVSALLAQLPPGPSVKAFDL